MRIALINKWKQKQTLNIQIFFSTNILNILFFPYIFYEKYLIYKR